MQKVQKQPDPDPDNNEACSQMVSASNWQVPVLVVRCGGSSLNIRKDMHQDTTQSFIMPDGKAELEVQMFCNKITLWP